MQVKIKNYKNQIGIISIDMTCVCGLIIISVGTDCLVRGTTGGYVFTGMCVVIKVWGGGGGGGGGVTPSPSHNTSTGPMPFLGGVPK